MGKIDAGNGREQDTEKWPADYDQAYQRGVTSELARLFREYWNDFITVQAFADYHSLTFHKAMRIIERGKVIHNHQAS